MEKLMELQPLQKSLLIRQSMDEPESDPDLVKLKRSLSPKVAIPIHQNQ